MVGQESMPRSLHCAPQRPRGFGRDDTSFGKENSKGLGELRFWRLCYTWSVGIAAEIPRVEAWELW
jgi:hypothetical protein